MMRPLRFEIMNGATARVTLNTPVTLVARTSATSSSEKPASGLSRITPALLTRMSIRPVRSATPSTAVRHASASRMSTCTAVTVRDAACAASTTASAASAFSR